MKRAALYLLLVAFLAGCAGPQKDLGQEWFAIVVENRGDAEAACQETAPEQRIELWQEDALKKGPDRYQGCLQFIRSIQRYSKKNLLGSFVFQYEPGRALGIACFREEKAAAFGETGILPVLFQGSGSEINLVDIAPHFSEEPWQPSPAQNRAAELVQRQLPQECQRATVWG